MLPKQVPKTRRASSGGVPKLVEPEKSPSSSTMSSSKHNLEASNDVQGLSSSSSARKRPAHINEGNLFLNKPKESVIVTVRFRPLSPREIRHGEELAWYADGDTIVRNESNPSIAYAYDRVFGPTTTTRHVYDVAAQNVISGAMEGINGTVFSYGVTSSGKTHTMHGDQRSPGIIPLAVKDAFSIIQETPNREFLLRVSYLEIYNEVVNDLLNPAGQNLRIREDSQGTFIEGIKEEVVLSPAHALSLIAAGEEHRHVGSTNFNVLSSRSHTIFTLTIESSPSGQQNDGEAVTFSQLNLIDLAGSESSKVETTGLRRKEGSYINKSLLTLGTVISKLTEGSSTHIPYRDSKLTRILQSSLSGRGRVSLICTITPASSSCEETHNTIKFAHRAKRIEILASQNKIIDEKSLIKKYQNEIRCLKDELEQLKKGIVNAKDTEEGDFVRLKQKLEDGQFKLQSRLEQEEEAKAVLLNRIQKLTKLILVSTKATQPSRQSNRPGPRRRHSFGEEELAYLPYKRRDLTVDEESVELYNSLEGSAEAFDTFKEEKKSRKHGLLNWLKMRKRESNEKAISQVSNSISSTPQAENGDGNGDSAFSPPLQTQLSLTEKLEEDFEAMSLGQESPASLKTSDQIELLREQQKILSGDVALQSSALKRLADTNTEESTAEMMRINEDIKNKNEQIALLEIQINSIIISQSNMSKSEMSHRIAELTAQLNEKSFELEVKAADNSIIQDQLSQKISECESMRVQLSKSTISQAQEANEIEELKEKLKTLENSKEQLELMNQKLREESSYAKGLASAAAVELKALSEEVAKLIDHNERLTNEVNGLKGSPTQRRISVGGRLGKRPEVSSDLRREVAQLREKELHYEAALAVKDQNETELLKRVEESQQREAYLENELANMWVLVAKLKKSNADEDDDVESPFRLDHFPA